MRPFRCMLILCCLGALPLHALDRRNLLLYVAFEDSLEPVLTRGEAMVGTTPDAVAYTAGVKGRAVIADANLGWQGTDLAHGDEGTVSLWIQPVDWSGGDGQNHHFCRWFTERGVARLYQYYPGNLGMLINNKTDGTRVCWAWKHARAGTWMHLAFTWNAGAWVLYIDGIERARRTDDLIPFGKISGIQVGDGRVAVDELMVFDRALSPVEIRALYYRIKRPQPPQ